MGTFLGSILEHIPEAEEKIVFDRYQLITHMVKAIDRCVKKVGNERLVGAKYLGLYSKDNLPDKRKRRFQSLMKMHINAWRAWAIK